MYQHWQKTKKALILQHMTKYETLMEQFRVFDAKKDTVNAINSLNEVLKLGNITILQKKIIHKHLETLTGKESASPKPTVCSKIELPSVEIFSGMIGFEKFGAMFRGDMLDPSMFPSICPQASPGILMYGPPGTGKTEVARRIKERTNYPFFSISPSDILGSLMGDSERNIETLFKDMRKNPLSILFIDEVDALLASRTDNDDSITRVKTMFLTNLDGVNKNPSSRVYFIACTNKPEKIDVAILRRLGKKLYIKLPTRENRIILMQSKLKEMKIANSLSHDDFEQLADVTVDYSGAAICSLIANSIEPIRADFVQSLHFKSVTVDGDQLKWIPCQHDDEGAVRRTIDSFKDSDFYVRPITIEDVMSALAVSRSSVSQSDLDLYDTFTEKNGSNIN